MLDKVIHTVFGTGWFFVFLLSWAAIPVIRYYVLHPKEFWYDITHDNYDPEKDCSGPGLN